MVKKCDEWRDDCDEKKENVTNRAPEKQYKSIGWITYRLFFAI